MLNPWLSPAIFFSTAVQYQKMWLDTFTVLDHRLPLLNAMMSDPAAAADPRNWLELNRMFTEKMLAFGHAGALLAAGTAQLSDRRLPTAQELLKLQHRALRPVGAAVSANARRLSAKKKQKRGSN